jgi:flagellar hook assembly protein FlgD
MRTTSGYEFVGTEAPREFDIRLREDRGTLAIMGLMGLQTRQGAAISFSLSTEADVTARILNIAGRPVRELVRDAAQEAGPGSLMWDLRSSSGSLVPNGLYLVELTARADDGQVSRATGKVSIAR